MKKSEQIALRATAPERELLYQASRVRESTLSEFVLGAAIAEAQHVLAERTHFELETDDWNRFVELLDRPPVGKPRLRRLLTEPSVLDR